MEAPIKRGRRYDLNLMSEHGLSTLCQWQIHGTRIERGRGLKCQRKVSNVRNSYESDVVTFIFKRSRGIPPSPPYDIVHSEPNACLKLVQHIN